MTRFFALVSLSLLTFALLGLLFGDLHLTLWMLSLGIILVMVAIALIPDHELDYTDEPPYDPSFEMHRDYIQARFDLNETARRTSRRRPRSPEDEADIPFIIIDADQDDWKENR